MHLWRLFSLVELTENMRQQRDQTFINILNALKVGKLTEIQIEVLIDKQNTNTDGEFHLRRSTLLMNKLIIITKMCLNISKPSCKNVEN